MIKIFKEIEAQLQVIAAGELAPPRVPVPEKRKKGVRKLGPLPLRLRQIYALNEFYLANLSHEAVRQNLGLKDSLARKQKIVLQVYLDGLRRKYRSNDDVSVYEDWIVRRVKI
ncbi:MAG TPA: hypothetical protein VMC41_03120 [Candidatus Nanoarchaeia archaeon]|nr:hypothetical protein [Candidatus Nanoarchaeia archaeon]